MKGNASNHFLYDENKNLKLKKERGVDFEDVINAVNQGQLIDVIPHHNQILYPKQNLLLVKIDGYVYVVPCLEENDLFILKTVFPSRKFTKLYGAN